MAESQGVIVARMDERVSQLVENVKTLTEAVTALTKEGARIDTVQTQVSALLRAQDEIWRELGKLRDELSSHQKAQARSTSSGLFEILRLLGAFLLGIVGMKWGAR